MHALVDSDHDCRFRQHEESKMKAYGCAESAFLDEKSEGNSGVNPGRSKARHRQTRLGESTSVVLRAACRLHLQAAATLVRVGAICAYTYRLLQPIVGHPRDGSQSIFRRGSHMAGMKNIMT